MLMGAIREYLMAFVFARKHSRGKTWYVGYYVNGKFVWVNAPRYEPFKWFGGKEVPFYVSVTNDPMNMSREDFDPKAQYKNKHD